MVHFRAFLHVSSAQKHMPSTQYAIVRLFRSVRPSVCHTGGSIRNGWSYD